MEEILSFKDYGINLIIKYVPLVLLAIGILILGLYVIKRLIKIIRILMDKNQNLSPEIKSFLMGMISIAMKVFLLLIIANIVGIDTASFVAVLAAASFAIGLALQGSLSNFAAGIIIVLFRPYKIGDWVEIQDKFGQVRDIQIFNTIIESPGYKTFVIPNSKVIDDAITNFSTKGEIRLELEVSVPYSENYSKVKSIISGVLDDYPNVLDSPKYEIGIIKYDSHNLIVAVRPFMLPDNYWPSIHDLYALIKTAFHKNGIQVAYSEGVELGSIGE